jgi:hypothetical protein
LFGALEERRFPHKERLDVDAIVERVASVSAVAVAPQEEQSRIEARVRELVADPAVDFALITTVIVADRV